MSLVEKAAALVTGGRARVPVGTVRVVDPSRFNWLHVLYNAAEELVRVTPDGHIEPAAMRAYRWVDNRALVVELRNDERFPDGQPLSSATVTRAFDEVMRWAAPHPPGTHFNLLPGTRCEAIGAHAVRFHFPAPDGLALGKLRAMHLMSTRFWEEVGFGYRRRGTGEGLW